MNSRILGDLPPQQPGQFYEYLVKNGKIAGMLWPNLAMLQRSPSLQPFYREMTARLGDVAADFVVGGADGGRGEDA